MKVEEQLRVRIESLAFEGKGVARYNGKIIFVKFALPGDLLDVVIIKSKKDYAEAKILSIIESNPNRIEPICKHFGTCGGCSFQNIKYSEQLFWKKHFVADALERIAKIHKVEINDVLPSERIFNYRNKVEFTFGTKPWIEDVLQFKSSVSTNTVPAFSLGFHLPNRFDKTLDIEECYLSYFRVNDLLSQIRQKALELNLRPYDLRTHKGFLRNLIIRTARHKNQVLINIVTTSQISNNEQIFLDWIESELSNSNEYSHVIHTNNDSYSPMPQGEIKVIKGEANLVEILNGLNFSISPFAFFQVNPYQAENLMKKVIEYAEPAGKVVWDLYCGSGTFSLALAKEAKFVYGIEINSSAVEDASINASKNNITNVSFLALDLHKKSVLAELAKLPKPDVVVLDPPRSGLHKNILNAIVNILPKKIIYVSCNPTTQSRDLFELVKFYNLLEIQPIDMFPQTYHIETIASLEII
ncbi:MAG: 23S rRNA (uracil(1939)-C(5))-methyltransferase RlmD [Ignavibacteria bacterium]|nr:23S rRNA (uracil(1939)-C(5))-methyltransferase RlmD [Ignavibacteria bacterium]